MIYTEAGKFCASTKSQIYELTHNISIYIGYQWQEICTQKWFFVNYKKIHIYAMLIFQQQYLLND